VAALYYRAFVAVKRPPRPCAPIADRILECGGNVCLLPQIVKHVTAAVG